MAAVQRELNTPDAPSPEFESAWTGLQRSEQDGSASLRPVIHLIEDDPVVRTLARQLFEYAGWEVQDHLSAEAFLAGPRPSNDSCLVVDVNLPGMSGLALLELLRSENSLIPAIMLTGRSDAAAAVAALKSGASDFIEKPANSAKLLTSISSAMERAQAARTREESFARAKARFDKLTPREREVMMMVLEGTPNKNIAADLGISQRTVESHRARVMQKTGARSVPALVQLYFEAAGSGQHDHQD